MTLRRWNPSERVQTCVVNVNILNRILLKHARFKTEIKSTVVYCAKCSKKGVMFETCKI